MAWPLTPLTTYVENSAPAISASDLNNIQNAINALTSNATTPLGGSAGQMYSVYALNADGAGGAPYTPTGGTVQVSATYAGSPGSAPPIHCMTRESMIVAWADTTAGGTLTKGFNVTITKPGTGHYLYTFQTNPTFVAGAVSCVANSLATASNTTAGASSTDVYTFGNSLSTAATDQAHGVIVFGVW